MKFFAYFYLKTIFLFNINALKILYQNLKIMQKLSSNYKISNQQFKNFKILFKLTNFKTSITITTLPAQFYPLPHLHYTQTQAHCIKFRNTTLEHKKTIFTHFPSTKLFPHSTISVSPLSRLQNAMKIFHLVWVAHCMTSNDVMATWLIPHTTFCFPSYHQHWNKNNSRHEL